MNYVLEIREGISFKDFLIESLDKNNTSEMKKAKNIPDNENPSYNLIFEAMMDNSVEWLLELNAMFLYETIGELDFIKLIRSIPRHRENKENYKKLVHYIVNKEDIKIDFIC
jgi:hypothetical protein